jgi:hypothetical protein
LLVASAAAAPRRLPARPACGLRSIRLAGSPPLARGIGTHASVGRACVPRALLFAVGLQLPPGRWTGGLRRFRAPRPLIGDVQRPALLSHLQPIHPSYAAINGTPGKWASFPRGDPGPFLARQSAGTQWGARGPHHGPLTHVRHLSCMPTLVPPEYMLHLAHGRTLPNFVGSPALERTRSLRCPASGVNCHTSGLSGALCPHAPCLLNAPTRLLNAPRLLKSPPLPNTLLLLPVRAMQYKHPLTDRAHQSRGGFAGKRTERTTNIHTRGTRPSWRPPSVVLPVDASNPGCRPLERPSGPQQGCRAPPRALPCPTQSKPQTIRRKSLGRLRPLCAGAPPAPRAESLRHAAVCTRHATSGVVRGRASPRAPPRSAYNFRTIPAC